MRADVEAKLAATGLRPLSDWAADWASHAVELRATLRAADNETLHNVELVIDDDGDPVEIGETERDHVLQAIHAAAGQLEQARGPSIAEAFLRAATTNEITLREVSDQWLAGLGRSQEKKTIAGHRKVFTDLERFVRERHGHQSLATMTFPGVTRRMAGEFIAWRVPGSLRRQ